MLGVMFTEADTSDKHEFKINVTHCNCGRDQKDPGINITDEDLHPLPSVKGYYPGILLFVCKALSTGDYINLSAGDMYDYYAVTLDPYYDALSSDRWPNCISLPNTFPPQASALQESLGRI